MKNLFKKNINLWNSICSNKKKSFEEGIAYSSRNEKLSKKQIQDFISFHQQSLNFLKTLEKSFDINTANQKAKDFIIEQDIEKLDYFEFRNNDDLSFNGKVSESRLFYAIYKGNN